MQTKEQKGSALVFSLVVLSMILVAALGVASVSVVEKRNSSATGKSTQAFQVADSAVEVVLKHAVLDPAGTTLQKLAEVGFGNPAGTGCAGGVISGAISGGTVDLTFVDASGATLTDCMGSNLSQVATVKSVGRSGDTTRAINSAVAAGTLVWNNLSLGSWSAYGASYHTAQYAKDSRTGIVYLRGLVKPTSNVALGANSTIGTLPDSSFYPPAGARKLFATACYASGAVQGATCRVDVNESGQVNLVASMFAFTAGSGYISLDGISYTAD